MEYEQMTNTSKVLTNEKMYTCIRHLWHKMS